MAPEEMNTTEPAVVNSKDGMEIKLSGKRLNLTALLVTLPLFIGGLIAFDFIWGNQPTEGSVFLLLVGSFLIYIVLQLVLYMLFTKGNFRAIKLSMNWKGCGFLYREPIALKYYRVTLLVPVILLGLIPAIHGFCTGYFECFIAGIFIIVGASGDCMFFWKLRHFDDEDRIKDGDETYAATIIKGDK